MLQWSSGATEAAARNDCVTSPAACLERCPMIHMRGQKMEPTERHHDNESDMKWSKIGYRTNGVTEIRAGHKRNSRDSPRSARRVSIEKCL